MVEGGERAGARLDRRVNAGSGATWRWALVAVIAVQSLVIVLLVVLDLQGRRLFEDRWDVSVLGNVADWATVVATAIAIPVAAHLSFRQIRLAQQDARISAEAERARLAENIRLRVAVVDVVDRSDLATTDEQRQVTAWQSEMRQRGWAHDVDGRWRRNGEVATTADLCARASGNLLPRPWTIELSLANEGTWPVSVDDLVVRVGQHEHVVHDISTIGAGEVHRRRLGSADSLEDAYSTPTEAEEASRRVVASIAVRNELGQSIHAEAAGAGRTGGT